MKWIGLIGGFLLAWALSEWLGLRGGLLMLGAVAGVLLAHLLARVRRLGAELAALRRALLPAEMEEPVPSLLPPPTSQMASFENERIAESADEALEPSDPDQPDTIPVPPHALHGLHGPDGAPAQAGGEEAMASLDAEPSPGARLIDWFRSGRATARVTTGILFVAVFLVLLYLAGQSH